MAATPSVRECGSYSLPFAEKCRLLANTNACAGALLLAVCQLWLFLPPDRARTEMLLAAHHRQAYGQVLSVAETGISNSESSSNDVWNVTYSFRASDGKEYRGEWDVEYKPDQWVSIEYLPSDPTVNRIAGGFYVSGLFFAPLIIAICLLAAGVTSGLARMRGPEESPIDADEVFALDVESLLQSENRQTAGKGDVVRAIAILASVTVLPAVLIVVTFARSSPH